VAGDTFTALSADRESSATSRDEVYVIDTSANAFLRNSSGWSKVDSAVQEISGADYGAFYDVNPPDQAWLFTPWRGWTFLAGGVRRRGDLEKSGSASVASLAEAEGQTVRGIVVTSQQLGAEAMRIAGLQADAVFARTGDAGPADYQAMAWHNLG